MSECPYVDHSFAPDPTYNEPVEYASADGATVYVYYRHDDGYGKLSNVQFCKLIGRKKDVFECLNENEWHRCGHYGLGRDLKEYLHL